VIVLALDLAIGTTGWAVLDSVVDTVRLRRAGHFTLPDRRKSESRASWNRRRYQAMRLQVRNLVSTYAPLLVAWEYPDSPRTIWSGGNKGREFHAMQGLGMAEGFILAILNEIPTPGMEQLAISTTEAKRAATGQQRGASKQQVRRWLTIRLGALVIDQLTDDEVDAVAVGMAALIQARSAAA
jgi:Holliday junction resolvasome RuvABC endonuclease subunit